MNATARKLTPIYHGVDKASFISSLQHLSDQIRRADQTLTIKTDEMIGKEYDVQYEQLKKSVDKII